MSICRFLFTSRKFSIRLHSFTQRHLSPEVEINTSVNSWFCLCQSHTLEQHMWIHPPLKVVPDSHYTRNYTSVRNFYGPASSVGTNGLRAENHRQRGETVERRTDTLVLVRFTGFVNNRSTFCCFSSYNKHIQCNFHSVAVSHIFCRLVPAFWSQTAKGKIFVPQIHANVSEIFWYFRSLMGSTWIRESTTIRSRDESFTESLQREESVSSHLYRSFKPDT